MAFLFFIVLIIAFLTIVLRSQSSYSIKFLVGIICGGALSFASFILYLSKFNLYYNQINAFLKLYPGSLSYSLIQFFNPDFLIRTMNIGVALFYYSYMAFIISFVQIPKEERRNKIIYILLLIPLLLQIVIFDPKLNILLQNILFNLSILHHFETISHYISLVFRTINIMYIVIGPLVLMVSIIKYIKGIQLKNYIIFSTINITVLGIAFSTLFYWAPTSLIRVTFSKYQNYLQPNLKFYFDSVYLLPAVILLTLLLMVINLLKYRSLSDYYKTQNLLTQKKIDTASMGMQIFTHSVKNHLLAIRSETEYLQSILKDNEKAMYSLNLIKDSTQQSFIRVDQTADKLKNILLQFDSCDIHKPIESVIEKMRLQFSEIELIYTPGKMELNCMIDEGYIEEVIHNILLNAVEAMNVKLELNVITVYINEVNDWAIISIEDNGVGIEEASVDKIFDPFFTTKTPISNWGIGLSYCYKIIEGHQGSIEVNSRTGIGTQFNIMIPTNNKFK